VPITEKSSSDASKVIASEGHDPASKGKKRHGKTEMVENRSAKADPQPEAAMPQLMDAQDVALILKIAPKTVHKLVRRGRLKSAVQDVKGGETE
jgi:hypothetical protein